MVLRREAEFSNYDGKFRLPLVLTVGRPIFHSNCEGAPLWQKVSGSNCCFLTCIQVSQESGKVVWYSHLFQNFPQFVMIHSVKGFSIVSEAEVDVFLEFPCFFMIQKLQKLEI